MNIDAEGCLWLKPNAACFSFSLDGSTHVWKITLQPDNMAGWDQWLSTKEKERAARFAFDRHRNYYIAAHVQLRLLLARYLNVAAQEIEFFYNEFGKPFLTNRSLYFNLSHSHELGLVAVNSRYEVGVDIEWIRPNFDDLRIAKRFFSPDEADRLFALPATKQKEAFFRCWSRKEAYIKGRGLGLAIPLNQFDVSFEENEPTRLLSTAHDPAAVNEWRLFALYPDSGYAGALVVNDFNADIRCWNGISGTSIFFGQCAI